MSNYPNLGVRNTSTSLLLFKAGGPWAPGFNGNVDNLVLQLNQAHVTYDFDKGPAFSIDDVTMAEGNGGPGTTSFTFTVTRTGGSAVPTSVDVATMDGTATAPSDYTAIPTTTLNFPASGTSETMQVTVFVNGDTTYEPTENFTVNLSNPVNATISDASGTGTITNDDGEPTFTVGDVSAFEGNTGTTPFVFTITKNGASGQNSTVSYATVSGTATTADSDYVATSGSVVFGPNDTTKQITVLVNGDLKTEADESFLVVLTSAVNERGEDIEGVLPSGTGTILNDDANPSFSIDNVTQAEGNAGTSQFVFTVTKSNPTVFATSVDYATQDGTAIAPSDYTAIPTTTLNFAPNQNSRQVSVSVNGDTMGEATEFFTVQLSNAVNATVGSGTRHGHDHERRRFAGDRLRGR